MKSIMNKWCTICARRVKWDAVLAMHVPNPLSCSLLSVLLSPLNLVFVSTGSPGCTLRAAVKSKKKSLSTSFVGYLFQAKPPPILWEVLRTNMKMDFYKEL